MLPFTTKYMDLVHLRGLWALGPSSHRGAIDCHLTGGGEQRDAGEKSHRRDAEAYQSGGVYEHGGSPFAERIEWGHGEGALL
jgi:hypothetical protein